MSASANGIARAHAIHIKERRVTTNLRKAVFDWVELPAASWEILLEVMIWQLIDRTIAASDVSYSSRVPQVFAGVRRVNVFPADRRIESVNAYLERARTVK